MQVIRKVVWEKPTKFLVFRQQQADVWLIDLTKQPTSINLSESEMERLAGYSDARSAAYYQNSRMAMRDILSRYLDVPPADIQYALLPGGKPILADTSLDVHFNLSHCGATALFVLNKNTAVGIDIECKRRIKDYQSLARRIFSPADQQLLQQAPSSQLAETFYQLWTAMEARQKAFGKGIFAAVIAPEQVSQLEFSVNTDCWASLAITLPNQTFKPRFIRYQQAVGNEQSFT